MPDSLSIATQSEALHFVAPPAPHSYDAPAGFTQQGLSSVIVDSIASDTVEGRVPHFIPVDMADSLRSEELAAHFPGIPVKPTPSGSSEGIAPTGPASGYVHSTPLTALMMTALVITALNAPSVSRAMKQYRSEMWSIRRRGNMFDDDTGVRLPTAILLGIVFVIFGGIVLYSIPSLPVHPTFYGAIASMGLAGAYYIFQLCAYGLVGYAFATPDESRRWLMGFNATQAYAGLLMALPAILTVCKPDWHEISLIISLTAYETLHLIFIIKGFRIFYRTFSSLLYFILYLCTLEILPQIALYRISVVISGAI